MISLDLILPHLDVTCKKQALKTLAENVAPLLAISPEQLFDALQDREKIGSTGIGNGTAIPHVRVEKAERIYAVLARLPVPVDFDAIDDQPVDILLMLVAPTSSKTTEHLKTLAQVSRFLRDPQNLEAIRQSADATAIAALVDNWSARQKAA